LFVVCCLLFVVCCLLFVVPLEGGMLKKATESEIPCFLAFVVCCLLFVSQRAERKEQSVKVSANWQLPTTAYCRLPYALRLTPYA